jgi:hypothetical protein
MTNEHIDSALDELRWAGNEQIGEGYDLPGFHLKSAHVHAMLAVAAEIADLRASIDTFQQGTTHPTGGMTFCAPVPAFTEQDDKR